MEPILQILLTSTSTVCTGILVLAVGQVLIKLVLDPLSELRKTLGEVADALNFYENVFSNPGNVDKRLSKEAQRGLRQMSTQLRARAYAVPLYPLLASFAFVPTTKQIDRAASSLMALSNSVFTGEPSQNNQWATEARVALDIPGP